VPLQTLLMTAIIVPLMAWVHMPLLTRLFRGWLTPR
jgi:antibiotic biosynthesis monooxygenase (ABM) superfamily enzyme